MLKIEREYFPSGGILVRMTGHAGAERNPEGHDLVCAAASMLCHTLAAALGRYCPRPVCVMEAGEAYLKGTPRTLCVSDFRAAYEAIMTGFELLARQYPECLEVGEWK